MAANHSNDLPLMANSQNVHLYHYKLDLLCDLQQKTFSGDIYLFLNPLARNEQNMYTFSIQDYRRQMREMHDRLAQFTPPDQDQSLITDAASLTHYNNCATTTLTKQKAPPPPGMDSSIEIEGFSDGDKTVSSTGKTEFGAATVNVGVESSVGKVACDVQNNQSKRCDSSKTTGDVSCKNNSVLIDATLSLAIASRGVQSELEGANIIEKVTSAGRVSIPSSIEKRQLETGTVDTATAAADASAVKRPKLSPPTDVPHITLDACDLDVQGVHEVDLPVPDVVALAETSCNQIDKSGNTTFQDTFLTLRKARTIPMYYEVNKWCIKIWKDGLTEYGQLPRLVKVTYSTRPKGPSLRWSTDQDGNPCVFTAAMWVNNRAFFPTAEYGNLSTWQARISTSTISPHGGATTVLMSSDGPGFSEKPLEEQLMRVEELMDVESGTSGSGWSSPTSWYHVCSSPLPPHTLAIAVGTLPHLVLSQQETEHQINNSPANTCLHPDSCNINFTPYYNIPCRIYAAQSVLEKAARVFRDYWAKCSRATQELLGACPFRHMDLLIYPPCVQDMALSNPGLIFLSQSLLSEDGSMNVRLGHELSHSWFGLLIGAKDWTEEWLSEGFATFVEDAIHAGALGISEQEEIERGELRALIRYKVLEAEMENTQQDLQTLRPDPDHGQKEDDDDSTVMYVKNGLNPHKQFTQVHYLKGYFLLRHLGEQLGMRKFCRTVLRSYIEEYHGQLVLSKDFLDHVFKNFPELRERGLSPDSIFSNWLDTPGIPEVIQEFQPSADNSLYAQVLDETRKWNALVARHAKKQSKKMKKNAENPTFIQLEPDQLVLMLEELLSSAHPFRAATMRLLNQTYNLHEQNADVRHRWCELVVKHGYKPGYDDVRSFLRHDQAMGVYLYGELVLSGCAARRALAEQCFALAEADMEAGTRSTVRAMLYGEEAQSEEETKP